MTTYAILLPADEAAWAAAGDAERARVYGLHDQFSQTLEQRGHKIVGGAELAHSSSARTVRGTPGNVMVTEGPYAETVEQLSGFYLVESEDLDDLADICAIISEGDPIEIRACVPPPSRSVASI
jgi:hypothetical protein